MKNRLYDCICVFIVLEILQSSISHAKIVNDTCRTKREVSVAETSARSKGDTSYAKEIQGINLERDGGDDVEEDDTYQDDTNEKQKISRKAADSVISTHFHQSNLERSIDHDKISNYPNLTRSTEVSDYPEEVDEEATKRERNKNEETSNLIRLPRYVNGDLDKYIDQDGRSSLYDDYEAKDVAKRGVLSGSEDYEEMDDSPEILQDMVAMQEQEWRNEAEKSETRKDVRMKRDQAVSETLNKSTLNPDDPVKLEESKIATKNPYSRQVSRIESSKNVNQVSAPNDASKIKGFGSNEMILKLSGSSKDQEPTSIIASSEKGELNAEYEKRVEEEIQRKIDSIKEEIQRDIEAQQRIQDIEENNARFDELQDQEHEDDGERQNFEGEPIERRQTVAKRSIREVANDAAVSSKRNGKKQSLKRKQHKKRQHRSSKIGKSDTLKENEDLKRRFVANHSKSFKQVPSKELFKKKRERVRQIFLVNNDQHETKKRQSRSYTSPSGRTAVRSENELFMNDDLNSHLHRDNRMLEVSVPVGNEDENNERKPSPTADHSDSLVSLTASSQELSPRLEKEYREAFGGLQSEPGSTLARYKRIKRVLAGPDAKISSFC